MRNGASVSQLLAVRCVPVGARITRVVSTRVLLAWPEVMEALLEKLGNRWRCAAGPGANRSSVRQRRQRDAADRLQQRPAAHELARRQKVGMQVTVIGERRDPRAHYAAHRFQRRARAQVTIEVAALGCGDE